MTKKLSDVEVQSRLSEVAGWSVVNGKLHREFKFADFIAAFGFMTRAALVAEKQDHHPEWLNVWNKVVVDLTTHDAGGISDRDFSLASRMNELAA